MGFAKLQCVIKRNRFPELGALQPTSDGTATMEEGP